MNRVKVEAQRAKVSLEISYPEAQSYGSFWNDSLGVATYYTNSTFSLTVEPEGAKGELFTTSGFLDERVHSSRMQEGWPVETKYDLLSLVRRQRDLEHEIEKIKGAVKTLRSIQ